MPVLFPHHSLIGAEWNAAKAHSGGGMDGRVEAIDLEIARLRQTKTRVLRLHERDQAGRSLEKILHLARHGPSAYGHIARMLEMPYSIYAH